ncbi:MAG: lipid A phosphoethanolamine transferase [Bacteroidales bacterium]|nr:lipid A phosphoethanolamine transferase [Bacteroidales bacterium]MCD8395088.1 lipid A phosphoethanolamine transferase [Bacteroidales bacterium]
MGNRHKIIDLNAWMSGEHLSPLRGQAWLALLVPIALIVPNIALCITEDMSWLTALANVLFPLGVYALIMSAWRRLGVTTWLCFPMMFFGAFQIVLLFLYGGSIIAVDMFLNVVTTNVNEATELLANLVLAMGIVIVLYVPLLVWATVVLVKRKRATSRFMRAYRRVSRPLCLLGTVTLGAALLWSPDFAVLDDLFPVNVCHNLGLAVGRFQDSQNYPQTSKDYTFHATHEPIDSADREVIVLVIGETSRAENWQLLGYERETNPRLSRVEGLVAFPKALTQSNTTHKSVPMMMSQLTATTFGDSINRVKSVITAFREAGFHTAFLSNQQRNRSYIDYFGEEADRCVFLKDDGGEHLDEDLLRLFAEELRDTVNARKFIVLHTYGSHFRYRDRYPASAQRFTPDDAIDARVSNRDRLINAFDNTIVYIDTMLADVIAGLDEQGCRVCMVYASDHGEDIFDDERGRFLHASPTPTAHQLHVPLLVYFKDGAMETRRTVAPSLTETEGQASQESPRMAALRGNVDKVVSPSEAVFHTLLDAAGVATPVFDPRLSLFNPSYTTPELLYLTDRNQAVLLLESGLKPQDLPLLPK